MSNSLMQKKVREKPFHGKGRVFSIDLKSRSAIRTASLDNGKHAVVLVEGTLGALKRAEFLEDVVLKVTGTYGVLRIDLAREELAEQKTKTVECDRS